MVHDAAILKRPARIPWSDGSRRVADTMALCELMTRGFLGKADLLLMLDRLRSLHVGVLALDRLEPEDTHHIGEQHEEGHQGMSPGCRMVSIPSE